MTTQQIQLIKRSWKIFQQINPEVVGDVFYSKLFADKPALRHMFPKEMKQQYLKLMDMLNTMVSRLDRMNELTDELEAMAARHLHYGVRPAHYKIVGKALLWTLEQGLGADFTHEVKQAWTACYDTIACIMIDSANKNTV